RWVTGAVGFAKSVAAGDERDGLFVVHGHAEERLADIFRGRDRIRVAVRTLRVDVDQAHLNGAERLRQLTLAAITFIAQPRPFWTPVKLLGLPHVGASPSEAEGLEAHRFQRDVAGENHQVGPRDLLA